MSRTIAIGDIHGCSIALEALIEAISPQPDDTIIPLGDYVDRGIDSKGVLDQLIELRDRCNLVPILGNHDQMMLHARDGRSDFQGWLDCGGDAALDSYGSSRKLDLIPRLISDYFPGDISNPHSRQVIFTLLAPTAPPISPSGPKASVPRTALPIPNPTFDVAS